MCKYCINFINRLSRAPSKTYEIIDGKRITLLTNSNVNIVSSATEIEKRN